MKACFMGLGYIGLPTAIIAAKHGIPNTAKLPIDPAIAAACDAGRIEDVQGDWLSSLADAIEGK